MKQQEQSAASRPGLVHNEAKSRYELHLDGHMVGQMQYRMRGSDVVFTHTIVDPALRGQHLGSRIAAFGLDDVKARGLKMVPQCPFVAEYIRRHEKEYGDLVAH